MSPAGCRISGPLMSALLAQALLVAGFADDGAPVAAVAPASELVVECDEVVRLGVVFLCTVSRSVPVPEYDRGPLILQITLTQAGQMLAASESPIPRLGLLRQGVQVALVPAGAAPSAQPVELLVTLTNPSRTDLQRCQRQLNTPQGLQRALATDAARLVAADAGRQDALPSLWVEEANEAMIGGASLHTCALLSAYHRQLTSWLAGRPPPLFPIGCSERALRDPSDGSVQPYRLHLPRRKRLPMPVVLLCSGAPGALRKSAWPMLPPTWLEAAREAGVAIVEVYPAGDRTWQGVALRRARLALSEGMRECPGLNAEHVILLGIDAGATGAIALAEDEPERWAALALVDPKLAMTDAAEASGEAASAMAGWFAAAAPGGRPAHLTGMAVSISGQPDPASQRWLDRLQRCGAVVQRQAPMPDDPAFWQAIAERPAPTPAREYVVLAPGRYGPVRVEAVSRWGAVASRRIDASSPLSLVTLGIAALTPDRPATVNGRPWRAVQPAAPPAKVLGQALGPLSAYSERPFAVVVGTIENPASAQDNRQLARVFLSAWGEHAQGRPPVFEDHEVHPGDLEGDNLVLIGNSRSNAVLKRLVDGDQGFPLHWDARNLICAGVSYLRDQHRAVALAWPHPAHDGRLLVVIDGALPVGSHAGGSTLPLAGLPDLAIGGDAPAAPLVVERFFDSSWR